MLVGLLVQKVCQLEEKHVVLCLRECFWNCVQYFFFFGGGAGATLHWNGDFGPEYGNLNC